MILVSFICFILWLAWFLQRLLVYRYHSFSGKTVLITNACSELGSNFCSLLYDQGANIIAWDSNLKNLEGLKKKVLFSKFRATEINGDENVILGQHPTVPKTLPSFTTAMVNLSSQTHVLHAAEKLVGRVDIILNVSHIFPKQPFLQRGHGSVQDVIFSNGVTPLLIAKVLCPDMLRRREGGHYVNIITSSGVGTISSNNPDYAASQWAAVGLHYSLRAWLLEEEMRQHGVGQVRTTLIAFPEWGEEITNTGRDSTFGTAFDFSIKNSLITGKGAVKLSYDSSTTFSETTGRCAKTIEKEIGASLQAIARYEEYYTSQKDWCAVVHAIGLIILPFPWQTLLSKIWRKISRLRKTK